MGFVKTADEIDALRLMLAKPMARNGRMLYIPFETDEAFVSEVLPPGLRPNGVPASLTVGEWRGSNAGPYRSAFLMVGAQPDNSEDHTGSYCLSFYVSGDSAILFGRPMMGEPKKLADIDFLLSGDELAVSVTRFGKKLIGVTAKIESATPEVPELPPISAYYYKHQPLENGNGLQYDPVLIRQKNSREISKLAVATANLSLQGTVHDPLGDVPFKGVKKAAYMEGDISAECSVVTTVDRKAFLPYAFAAYDDWTVLARENGSGSW